MTKHVPPQTRPRLYFSAEDFTRIRDVDRNHDLE